MAPRYPDVTVPLTGRDGNAMAVIARVRSALRRGGVNESELDLFASQAFGGDYNRLLATVEEWVTVE